MKEQEKVPEIRVTSHGGSEGQISLTGFQPNELEKMLAAMSGAYWIRVDSEKGRLITIPKYEATPTPVSDEEMLPFWRKHSDVKQIHLFDDYEFSKEKGHSPSISIQSLCGYYYTKENYKRTAENLERWGFECLRSRRGEDGKFWEVWFLPGLWHAKEELKMSIESEKRKGKDELSTALEFLRNNSSFGTLDVSSQRMCMRGPGDDGD